MKKLVLVGALLSSFFGKTQFSQSDLIYYVGSGPDTAVCVVDFLDNTADSSYAWGYLFDASANVQASTMLADIAAAEPQLTINTSAFLNDIYYNAHEGVAATPNYWGTWSKTVSTAWSANGGIGDTLANGDWFGMSYTDFSPAVAPGEPIPAYNSNKWSAEDVMFWAGTGTDSAVFIADFVSSSTGAIATYSWGYLFNGTSTGQDMLDAIALADPNLDIATGSGFLNDITYNDLAGLAGNPNYWGTWSGTNLTDWTMNAGLSTVINPNDWFGASYESWPPRRPFYPNAALDSASFVISDVINWTGIGPDSTVILIDFNAAEVGESFAFGYAFDATTNVTAETALTDIAAANTNVTVVTGGGFLNDITLDTYAGIGGAPNYWSTWSGTNVGGFSTNTGIGEVLTDGNWFACSYTDFNPATPVSGPIAAGYVNLSENNLSLSVYPNPFDDAISINGVTGEFSVVSLNGSIIASGLLSGQKTIQLDGLNSGVYILMVSNGTGVSTQKIIKK